MNEYFRFTLNLYFRQSSFHMVNEYHIFKISSNKINANIFQNFLNYKCSYTNLCFLKILYRFWILRVALFFLLWTLLTWYTLDILVTWVSHKLESRTNCRQSEIIIKATSRKVTSIYTKSLLLSSEPPRGAELRPFFLLKSSQSLGFKFQPSCMKSTSIIKPHLIKGNLGPNKGVGGLNLISPAPSQPLSHTITPVLSPSP